MPLPDYNHNRSPIPAPVPVTSNSTSTSTSTVKNNHNGNGNDNETDNPYLTATLASTLRISSSEASSPGTVLPGHPAGAGSGPGTGGVTPTPDLPVPLRLEGEGIADIPGEADPSASIMDLSTLPKSYLEVGPFSSGGDVAWTW